MRKRARTGTSDRFLAKVLVWAAGRAIESLPVVGPVFRMISLVNDFAEVSRACASE